MDVSLLFKTSDFKHLSLFMINQNIETYLQYMQWIQFQTTVTMATNYHFFFFLFAVCIRLMASLNETQKQKHQTRKR